MNMNNLMAQAQKKAKRYTKKTRRNKFNDFYW